LDDYKYDFISVSRYTQLDIIEIFVLLESIMQLSTILVAFFLGCIFFFDKNGSGHETEFPVETCASAIFSGNFAACTKEVAKNICKWHQWGDNTPDARCGFPCKSNLKGRFFKWDGKLQCDSNAPGIVGEATKRSKN
jgi:hypothetical protein